MIVMEDYPLEFVEHNLPLIFVSGIASDSIAGINHAHSENGSKFSGQLPLCKSDRSDLLLEKLLQKDGSQKPWNGLALPASPGGMLYKFKFVARVSAQGVWC